LIGGTAVRGRVSKDGRNLGAGLPAVRHGVRFRHSSFDKLRTHHNRKRAELIATTDTPWPIAVVMLLRTRMCIGSDGESADGQFRRLFFVISVKPNSCPGSQRTRD
jgi:hypothetical protein